MIRDRQARSTFPGTVPLALGLPLRAGGRFLIRPAWAVSMQRKFDGRTKKQGTGLGPGNAGAGKPYQFRELDWCHHSIYSPPVPRG